MPMFRAFRKPTLQKTNNTVGERSCLTNSVFHRAIKYHRAFVTAGRHLTRDKPEEKETDARPMREHKILSRANVHVRKWAKKA